MHFEHLASWLLWGPVVLAFVVDALWKRSERSSGGRLARMRQSARIDALYYLFFVVGRGGLLTFLIPIGVLHWLVVPRLPVVLDPHSWLEPGLLSTVVLAGAALFALLQRRSTAPLMAGAASAERAPAPFEVPDQAAA